MKLLPKLKLNPQLARMSYAWLLKMGYRFVDMDTESVPPDGRVIESSFVLSHLVGYQRGKVLDIGCTEGANIACIILATLGWEVYGIDIRQFKFEHPNFHFTLGDIRNTPFPDNFFDYVYAQSTIEHIGLKGRYGITEEDPDGDIKAVGEIARIVRPGGVFLVTIPYGKGQIVKPMERIYDKSRLQKLLSYWRIEDKTYYIQDDKGYWLIVAEEVAAQKDYSRGGGALALLELTPLK